MSAPREFSDETLTAFLDGETDAEVTRAINAKLETSAALAEQLDALRFPEDKLGSAFDYLLVDAPAMPDLPSLPAMTVPLPIAANLPERPQWRGIFAGGASGLVAGLVAAVYLGIGKEPVSISDPNWLDVVANYQMLYVPDTLDPSQSTQISADDATRRAALATLSDAVGVDLKNLETVEGLQFRRAQRLGFQGKTLIQGS